MIVMFEKKISNCPQTMQEAYCIFTDPGLSDYAIMGEILDISLDGICMKYLSNKGGGLKNDEFIKVRLLHAGNSDMSTGLIQCRIVCDEPVMDRPSGYIRERRCDLKFDQQKGMPLYSLENFIQRFTINEQDGPPPVNLARMIESRSCSLDG